MNVDSNTIELCKKKDRKAQEKLYYQLYPYIMGICYRYYINQDEAKDIANMSLCKILMNIEKYDPAYAMTTWVSKITVNTILEEFRKKKNKLTVSYDDASQDSNTDTLIYFHFENLNYKDILKCIEHLSDVEKHIFNLYFIDGYTHKEVAEMMEISEGTSKWYIHQIKIKLKKIFLKQNFLQV
jgi:RNA polymerase sigma-70 factor (ECF subfamily)